jgi:hypothetical protein
MASSIGLATLTSWVLLRLFGPRPVTLDMIEVFGRIVGAYWITMIIVKLWEESNIYSAYLREL